MPIKNCSLLFAVAMAASAATVTVTNQNPGNWTDTGSVPTAFAYGPATPPLGQGSLAFNVGPDGDQFNRFVDATDYNGVLLSDVTSLSYSTYQQVYTDGQAVYLSFTLSNGDRIYFEPVYQTGSYSGDPVPNQCIGVTNCAGLNQWQTWDAMAGGWWSNNGFEASNGGPPVFTLADYTLDNPGVTIIGLRLLAGAGAPPWNNFVGYADALTIGVSGLNTTYDFEAVPEPGSIVLLALGFSGVLAVRGRRK
jgi:hypothetical protein